MAGARQEELSNLPAAGLSEPLQSWYWRKESPGEQEQSVGSLCGCQREEHTAQVFACQSHALFPSVIPSSFGPREQGILVLSCHPRFSLYLHLIPGLNLLTSLHSEQCALNPGCCHLWWDRYLLIEFLFPLLSNTQLVWLLCSQHLDHVTTTQG